MIETIYGDDLKGVAKSQEELEAAIADTTDKLSSCQTQDKAKLLSELGSLLRIARRLPEARKSLEAAAMLQAEAGETRGLLVTRIRLAHVLQWQHHFPEADEMFRSCLQDSRQEGLDSLTHFVHQHYGKSLFDQERYREALDEFQKALAIREALGNPELLASTRLAIETTQMRLKVT